MDSERIITRLRAEGYEIARKHDGADLVVVNKFGKQEALGEGLRDEIAKAAMAGLPVLLAVRLDFLPAWRAFVGEDWAELAADADTVERWAIDATRLAA